MKRFMKGCAVTALIFAALGSVMAFLGSTIAGRTTIAEVVEAVTRGRVHVNPVSWWNWRLRVADGVVDAEIADFVDMMVEEGYDYSHSHGDKAYLVEGHGDNRPVTFREECKINGDDGEKYCPGEGIRNLEIDVGGCYFQVEYSDDEYLYLEVEKAYKFQSILKGDTLYVESSSKSATNWTSGGSCEITLYVPGGYEFDKVEIDMGAGYMTLGDLFADHISLEAGAGEIDISYVESPNLDISVGAGAVIIDYMDVDCLEAEIGMGQFQANGAINQRADIECSMGNVDLCLDGERDDFNYELDGSMGNIDIGDDSFSGFAQERHIDNGASKEIEVECSMGNISILFMY